MGFRVFGSAEVLSVHTGVDQRTVSMQRQAHRAVFSYEPRPGYVYVRSRAISSRCNDNFDFFGADEIEKAYETFKGKPVFVNHHNSDHKQARGVIIDAALHRDRNPNGSPDTWVEVLMEVDGVTYPKLAKALVEGDIDRTSMGCDVQISKCSVCANVARNPTEYCRHIPGMKGKEVVVHDQRLGKRVAKLVYEECFGLSFFENSLLVEPPADPTAFFLGRVEVGPGLDHLAKAARLQAVTQEPNVPQPMQRTASRRTASFIDDYPSDKEVDERRAGGFGGGDPWVPYKHQLLNRPAPREVDSLPHLKGVPGDGINEGTRYIPAQEGEKGAIKHPSPDDQYHGPYEVVRHSGTGMHHVVDNAGRVTRYGGSDRKGIADVHQAEYSRDYAEHRQQSKEKARGIADKLWGGMHEIFDPGGTDESRDSERKTRGMNNLLNLGYHPKDVHFDADDEPYGKVSHPSGWHTRDSGGIYVHLHHDATGDEAHDLINVGRNDSQSGRTPGYGPTEAAADLHHFVTGPEEETGGIAAYHEKNDPRIRRWKQQHMGSLQFEAKPRKQTSEMTPEEYAAHQVQRAKDKKEGEAWNRKNPVRIKHIVDHWNQGTDDEHANGMNWYADAHHMAKHIANDTGTEMHTMAGLVSNYSPQTHWATNVMNAARVARTKIAQGGKGEGILATRHQKSAAQRMLSGEHYDKVLAGPKTRAFAHLIEHGGNANPEDPKVVIDRHALSVATGARASDVAYEYSKLGNVGRYKEVSQAYHKAAKQISRQVGYPVHAHQVQAATWLTRQRLNEKHDRDMSATASSSTASIAKNTIAEWNSYAAEHHPGVLGKEPGTGYSQSIPEDVKHATDMKAENMSIPKVASRRLGEHLAYSETKAPQDVDTLRDEACAICGNDVAFDGRECQVCGYIKPPKGLDDPDVDKAKQLDQLKQNIDDERNDSGADPSQMGADFEAGDMSDAEPGGDNSDAPWLACPSCGAELRPGAAQTTTADPSQSAPAGLAEGGQCPVCGEGPLASTGESEDQTDDEAMAEEQAEQDPEADPEQDAEQDPDEPGDEPDEDDEDPKSKKNPAGRTTAAMKYRDHSKEFPMNQPRQRGGMNGLTILASLQEDNQRLAAQNQYLRAQVDKQDGQIRSLSACMTVVARHLGPQVDTAMRRAAFLKRADEQNPAQPVPEPAPQPPTQTTVQAETPEAFANVMTPGMVPGVNNDVAADAVTTAYTPGADIQTSPLRNLVDPTAPVEGTQGPRPLGEVKTNVEVRAGNPMNPQQAFPLGGEFANAQRTGSVGVPGGQVPVSYANEATQAQQPHPHTAGQVQGGNEVRMMASIRLARLRIAAGLEQQGESADLIVGQRIASDQRIPMEQIQHDIQQLNEIRNASAQRTASSAPRGVVPRPAAAPQRIVPPLGYQGNGGFQSTASNRNSEDEDLAAALSL